MLDQKLGALKSFRQCFAHGLLDHARAGKANERLGFRHDHIAKHGEAGRHTTHGRVGQHRDKRQTLLAHAR